MEAQLKPSNKKTMLTPYKNLRKYLIILLVEKDQFYQKRKKIKFLKFQ